VAASALATPSPAAASIPPLPPVLGKAPRWGRSGEGRRVLLLARARGQQAATGVTAAELEDPAAIDELDGALLDWPAFARGRPLERAAARMNPPLSIACLPASTSTSAAASATRREAWQRDAVRDAISRAEFQGRGAGG